MSLHNIRTGVDLVDIRRFREIASLRGLPFLSRIFTPLELARKNAIPSLAARFAAKEAFMKALGTGLSDGVSWHDIEIVRGDGPPEIRAAGRAGELLGARDVSLSISHTADTAVAFVVISNGTVRE